MLTDTNLRNLICNDKEWTDKDKLHIYPFSEDSLTPVGYDLSVGGIYSSSLKGGPFELKGGDKLTLYPGDTTLITTLETVDMPKNRAVSAIIQSKVSKVSKGLSHISTTIDPDWEGHLLIAVHNHSKNSVRLEFGETFCTVVFFENKLPSTKDCQKIPGRLDIFLNQWSEAARKTRKRERVKAVIPVATIVLVGGLGYFIFGNNPGFIAVVAIGVALSQIISFILRR